MIEFVIAGENAAEAFYSTKESLDVIALAIESLVESPRFEAKRIRRNHRPEAKQGGQTARFIAFISSVHDQGASMRGATKVADQLAPLRAVAILARGKPESDGPDIIRGNQMNFGVPSAA